MFCNKNEGEVRFNAKLTIKIFWVTINICNKRGILFLRVNSYKLQILCMLFNLINKILIGEGSKSNFKNLEYKKK